MSNPIQFPGMGQPIRPITADTGVQAGAAAQTKDFRSILLDSLEQVNKLQNEADAGVQRLLSGETNNVAEVLAASNKAGIAFDLLMEVRNKLTDAYREIQQMRV